MTDNPHEGVGMHISSDPDTTKVSQPETGDARETNQLPLRLLLVSNLTPNAYPEDWSEGALVHSVNKHSLAELMQQLSPRLSLEVDNKVSASPRLLELDLSFSSLDDFKPDRVAAQVPPIAQLVSIRSLVHQMKDGDIDVETFRMRLNETGIDADWAERLYQTLSRAPVKPLPRPASSPSSSSSGGSDAVDRLFGMIDMGGDTAEPEPPAESEPTSLVGSLMQAVSGTPEPKATVEKSAAGQLIADLDEVLGAQLNAIMGDAGFRNLEASWRGLKFLTDRINFRKNIQLDVLAAPKDELDNAIYHQILLPEYGGKSEKAPLSAILLDAAFDHSNADVAHLNELADTAASLQVPMIGAVDAAFFRIEDDTKLSKVPVLWQHLDTPEYIDWHKLRERQEARFLSLALPSFLLRASYGEDQPVRAFTFTEAGHLWGRASLLVGTRIADSFAETGWPSHLSNGGTRKIGDLPLWKSPQGHTPLAALIPDSKFGEFKKAGFVVLGGRVNRDEAYLARANTVCKADTYDDLMAAAEARDHVTLACQLFVARAAHYMLSIQDSIPPDSDIEKVKLEIVMRMRAFFHAPGQQVPDRTVLIQHIQDAGLPNHELFALRMNPPPYTLDHNVSLVLAMQVPKASAEA